MYGRRGGRSKFLRNSVKESTFREKIKKDIYIYYFPRVEGVRTQEEDRRHAWSRYLTTPATGMIVIHLSGRRSRYVKQFVVRAHVHAHVFFFLFFLLLLLLLLPPPPLFLPLPRFLIHLHSMRGVYLSVIVVDIFINIYDNVAIFTFTTSFVWLKCFVPMIYVPGNIYSYLLSTAFGFVQKRVKSRVIYVFLRKLNKFNLNLLSRFKLIELFRVYS